MARKCKCFSCEEVKEDCDKVTIEGNICGHNGTNYYCFDCAFDLGFLN